MIDKAVLHDESDDGNDGNLWIQLLSNKFNEVKLLNKLNIDNNGRNLSPVTDDENISKFWLTNHWYNIVVNDYALL